ncbi:NHL repeat-containing protein [Hahella sp. SMD15-11]|uniref:NHL repeat-containing protein n=1 Tax=Thermohahella caldifontis TaxID=3142973 RepID=A0AB39USZ0_9GAMM
MGNVPGDCPETPCQWDLHPQVTLNAPVGCCVDREGRIWLADTGNNRILILDRRLKVIRSVFGHAGQDAEQFNLPFRLAAHPHRRLIAVSDMANRRVRILAYDRSGHLGDQVVIQHDLCAPNGVVWIGNVLAVADEFYADAQGRGRVALFDDRGNWLRDLTAISGMHSPGLLWPQGVATDAGGRLYIANTGFGTVVRCDLSGQGVAFASTGNAELGGMELARDVCVQGNRLLVPGAAPESIGVFDLDGRSLGQLDGFFVPVNVAADPKVPDRIWVTDPVLGQIQAIQILGPVPLARVVVQAGPPRRVPGQLHYATSAVQPRRALAPPRGPWFWQLWYYGFQWQLTLAETAFNLFWGRRTNETEPVWALSAAEPRVEVADLASSGTPRGQAVPDSPYLPPGSLGMALFYPAGSVPQLEPGFPLLLVSNYLLGQVLVLQHAPGADDWVFRSAFGGSLAGEARMRRPQGLCCHRGERVWVADSGRHQILCWQVDALGGFEPVKQVGTLGDGPGAFHGPSDISVGPDGRLYVADQFNHRVQILDERGRHLRTIGRPGYGSGGDVMLLPAGIHCLKDAFVVNDLVNRKLKRYSLDGEFMDVIGELGGRPEEDQFWMPYLLSGDQAHALVPDCALNRVVQYRPGPARAVGTRTGAVVVLPVLEAARRQSLDQALKTEQAEVPAWDLERYAGRAVRELNDALAGLGRCAMPHWR